MGSGDAFREQGRVDEVTMNLKMTRPVQRSLVFLWDTNIQVNAHE